MFIAKDLDLSITQKAFLVCYLCDCYGAKRVGVASMTVTPLPLAIGWLAGYSRAIGQLLVFAAVACLGVATGSVGAAGAVRAVTGTFASGFITFGLLALAGALLISLRGRIWADTFLGRNVRSYAFAIEEG